MDVEERLAERKEEWSKHGNKEELGATMWATLRPDDMELLAELVVKKLKEGK